MPDIVAEEGGVQSEVCDGSTVACGGSRNLSASRWFFDVVDNDKFDGTFSRLQFEPKLTLHSLKNRAALR
jgi:hypothetical protein